MARKTSARRRQTRPPKQTVRRPRGRSSIRRRTPRQGREAPADALWETFEQSHQGHPALGGDVLYALPSALLGQINHYAPEFFSDEELAFEEDLANTGANGFFLKQPFCYPMLPSWNPDQTPSADAEETALRGQQIRSMMESEMRDAGRSDLQIKSYFRDQQESAAQVRERQLGYAGWLATHPEFKCELCRLVARWQNRLRELGGFPAMPISFVGERPANVPKQDRAFHTDLMQFYLRWGLDSLATWHLPILIRPQLTAPNLYSLSMLSEAGMTLFIPWHLLRFKDINVYELAAREQIYHAPAHLQNWLATGQKGLGRERFGTMLKLYIIFELCLKPRYGEHLRRQKEKLIEAAAEFLTHDRPSDTNGAKVVKAETVRKIRVEMNQRLRECQNRLQSLEAR